MNLVQLFFNDRDFWATDELPLLQGQSPIPTQSKLWQNPLLNTKFTHYQLFCIAKSQDSFLIYLTICPL